MTTPEAFTPHLPRFLGELRELVAIETPTGNVEAIARAFGRLAPRLERICDVETVDLGRWGPMLRARRAGTGAAVLLLAHVDTVWPVGSWPSTWIEAPDRVSGPGVYDMKSGLLLAVWALEALAARGAAEPEIELLITPDEEIGSLGSRSAIEEAARRADLVLVLEPTVPGGPLKIARKGSGEFFVTIGGRAAHQGVEPEKGVNAVVDAAHQILAMTSLEDHAAGTTVGPNVIHGGSASNVVPERVDLRVDVRVWSTSEQDRIDGALNALEPVVRGASIEIGGGWNRPPMEATPLSMAVFERAREVGAEIGLDITPVAWGGSSDANLTAAVGSPTVDGFGPAGEGAHQRDEHILVSSIPDRLALLTRLLASLSEPPERWLSGEARRLHERRCSERSAAAREVAVGT